MVWWYDSSFKKNYELHYKYLTWITCTTIQLHSQGNVSIPCLWKNSNILSFDWLDQITNDNGISILAAGVFLKLITKYIMRCPLFSVTSTTIWMYSGKWPSYISNFFKFRLSHCTLRRGGGGCIFVQTSYNNQHFHTFFYLYGFSSMEQATCVHMLNSHPMTWNATKC